MKFKDLLALLIIFVANCFVAVSLIFFFSIRAPNRPMNISAYFQWGSQSLYLILGSTLLFWLAYLFYFKKQM